ncbi:LysR family transcriptional regulator [Endozoicomonas numazuensis]|uniref:LysR family transcriptional regulator n=1 Tax=Endozoicomonas numazuensis TaxID=1137799 RepID=A0A081NEV0_9GAMM|nr:LysR family transcriptional regulator [Endozoicomonas numazuensis]KEQ16973.1 LysR family transcriptional regulator [Endozoicomonas numazuensis]
MDKKFDLKMLEVFLEVYQLGSITQAADALDMTQPGVSGVLKRLQEQLGVELFVREGRGITATHHAMRLADEIEPAFGSVYSALENLKTFDVQSPHQFKVFANEPMLQRLLPRVESDLSMGQCRIEFHLTPNDEEQLLQQLSLQKADLAIDVGGLSSHSYESKPFFLDQLVLVCSRHHPRVQGEITEQQYYAEKHIAIQLRRSHQYLADYIAIENLEQRSIAGECNSLLSMMALLAKSECLGATTMSLAEEYARSFDLQILTPPFSFEPVTHRMLWHKRSNDHAAHQWLRRKLQELVS